jgi:hypothetical protein
VNKLTGVTKEKCRDFVLILSLNWEGRSDEVRIGRGGGRRGGMARPSGLYYSAALHRLAQDLEDKKTWRVQPTLSRDLLNKLSISHLERQGSKLSSHLVVSWLSAVVTTWRALLRNGGKPGAKKIGT